MGVFTNTFHKNLGSRGLISWEIPFKTDALFWLNGLVVGNTFVDQSGNHRHFTITNKDFVTNWVYGFPYKSAATIAAPVGDAILIAADINNFLYDAGGTPNQISVTALFQDVDYENKFFNRHAPQILDVNGAEIYEPRVLDITLYANIKTGTDLTTCQSYYDVPTENATALWVTPTGSDLANGAKATPWLTLDKAFDTENSGKIVYCKSSNQAGDSTLGYLYNAKNNQLICIGKVKTTGNTSYGSYWKDNQNPPVITGLFIDSATGINLFLDSLPVMVMEKLRLNTAGTTTLENRFKELNNSVLTGTNSSYAIYEATNQEWFIDTCLLNLTATYLLFIVAGSGNPVVKNSKLRGTYSVYPFKVWSTQKLSLIGNDIDINSTNDVVYILAGGSLIFTDNIAVCNNNGGEGFIHIEDSVAVLTEIRRNIITNVAFTQVILKLQNVDCKVTDNLIRVENATYSQYSEIYCLVNGLSTVPNCEITGNKVLSKRTGQYNICIGNESTTLGDNKVSNALIAKNYVKATHAYASGNYAVHSLYIGFQSGSIRHNYVWGGGFGAIIKGSGTYTSDIQYNVLIDCARPAYTKGQSGISIVNNTIINDSVTPQFGVWLGNNTGGDEAVNCIVKNNIIAYLGTFLGFLAIDAESATNDIDYNIYYSKTARLEFRVAGVEKTFAEWQALGYDTHSVVLTDAQFNALFVDLANNDYSLKAGSMAIGTGVDLGAAYDDGLDASTIWGSDLELPVVVTKQQGVNWDIGAYIS